MKRPAWWNRLHDEGMALLTSEWQRLDVLKNAFRGRFDFEVRRIELDQLNLVLFDLVVAGAAERRVEPVRRNGVDAGFHLFYRKAA